MYVVIMITKICNKCNEEKLIDCFPINGKYVRSICKKCHAQKRYLFVSKNKSKVLKQNKISYVKNKKEILLKKKEYYIKNQKLILENHKEYYIKNKELILKKIHEYRQKYPEVYRASNSKRRAKIVGAICKISTQDIIKLKEKYNYCCAYCGQLNCKDNPLQIDHMIPLSKGGAHVIDNLLPACRKCNLTKFVMNWNDWCEKIGYTLDD